MPETLSGSKPDKVAGDKVEALTTRQNTEKVEALATKENVEAPATTDGKRDIGTQRQREERIATIDAKREEELTGLNAARTQLGLTPTDTSVAIAALDHERTVLAGPQRDERTQKQTESQPTGTPEIDRPPSLSPVSRQTERVHAGEQREGDNQKPRETANALQLFDESSEASRITPEIRYYFREILGPEETMRRMQEMQQTGPKNVARVRKAIESGNLHQVVSEFTGYDPEVKRNEEEIRREWNQTAPRNPYGHPKESYYDFLMMRRGIRLDKMMNDVEGSIRGARDAAAEGVAIGVGTR